MQSPAPGEEQPHAPVLAGGHPGGKQLCGKDPGVLVDTKLNKNQQSALITMKASSILGSIRRVASRLRDPFPLVFTGEAITRVLGPVLSSLVQERHGYAGGKWSNEEPQR